MNRIQIIQTLLDRIVGKTYLEIGSQNGDSFFKICAKRKLAVDPKFKIPTIYRMRRTFSKMIRLEEERYFEMTSDDFFLYKSNLFRKNKIDIALIDGLHTYKQSLRDVLSCLGHLSENGVIVIHDCNPQSEAMAYPSSSLQDAERLKLPGWAGYWCGDVWKTIVYLRSSRSDLNVFVLDCDFGVGLVARGKQEKLLGYSLGEIEHISYHEFESQRTRLLNLRPDDYLQEFLASLYFV